MSNDQIHELLKSRGFSRVLKQEEAAVEQKGLPKVEAEVPNEPMHINLNEITGDEEMKDKKVDGIVEQIRKKLEAKQKKKMEKAAKEGDNAGGSQRAQAPQEEDKGEL
jgi:hypothetical protein